MNNINGKYLYDLNTGKTFAIEQGKNIDGNDPNIKVNTDATVSYNNCEFNIIGGNEIPADGQYGTVEDLDFDKILTLYMQGDLTRDECLIGLKAKGVDDGKLQAGINGSGKEYFYFEYNGKMYNIESVSTQNSSQVDTGSLKLTTKEEIMSKYHINESQVNEYYDVVGTVNGQATVYAPKLERLVVDPNAHSVKDLMENSVYTNWTDHVQCVMELQTLSMTETGQKAINEAVTFNSDGSATVQFRNGSYNGGRAEILTTFSASDVSAAKELLSSHPEYNNNINLLLMDMGLASWIEESYDKMDKYIQENPGIDKSRISTEQVIEALGDEFVYGVDPSTFTAIARGVPGVTSTNTSRMYAKPIECFVDNHFGGSPDYAFIDFGCSYDGPSKQMGNAIDTYKEWYYDQVNALRQVFEAGIDACAEMAPVKTLQTKEGIGVTERCLIKNIDDENIYITTMTDPSTVLTVDIDDYINTMEDHSFPGALYRYACYPSALLLCSIIDDDYIAKRDNYLGKSSNIAATASSVNTGAALTSNKYTINMKVDEYAATKGASSSSGGNAGNSNLAQLASYFSVEDILSRPLNIDTSAATKGASSGSSGGSASASSRAAKSAANDILSELSGVDTSVNVKASSSVAKSSAAGVTTSAASSRAGFVQSTDTSKEVFNLNDGVDSTYILQNTKNDYGYQTASAATNIPEDYYTEEQVANLKAEYVDNLRKYIQSGNAPWMWQDIKLDDNDNVIFGDKFKQFLENVKEDAAHFWSRGSFLNTAAACDEFYNLMSSTPDGTMSFEEFYDHCSKLGSLYDPGSSESYVNPTSGLLTTNYMKIYCPTEETLIKEIRLKNFEDQFPLEDAPYLAHGILEPVDAYDLIKGQTLISSASGTQTVDLTGYYNVQSAENVIALAAGILPTDSPEQVLQKYEAVLRDIGWNGENEPLDEIVVARYLLGNNSTGTNWYETFYNKGQAHNNMVDAQTRALFDDSGNYIGPKPSNYTYDSSIQVDTFKYPGAVPSSENIERSEEKEGFAKTVLEDIKSMTNDIYDKWFEYDPATASWTYFNGDPDIDYKSVTWKNEADKQAFLADMQKVADKLHEKYGDKISSINFNGFYLDCYIQGYGNLNAFPGNTPTRRIYQYNMESCIGNNTKLAFHSDDIKVYDKAPDALPVVPEEWGTLMKTQWDGVLVSENSLLIWNAKEQKYFRVSITQDQVAKVLNGEIPDFAMQISDVSNPQAPGCRLHAEKYGSIFAQFYGFQQTSSPDVFVKNGELYTINYGKTNGQNGSEVEYYWGEFALVKLGKDNSSTVVPDEPTSDEPKPDEPKPDEPTSDEPPCDNPETPFTPTEAVIGDEDGTLTSALRAPSSDYTISRDRAAKRLGLVETKSGSCVYSAVGNTTKGPHYIFNPAFNKFVEYTNSSSGKKSAQDVMKEAILQAQIMGLDFTADYPFVCKKGDDEYRFDESSGTFQKVNS